MELQKQHCLCLTQGEAQDLLYTIAQDLLYKATLLSSRHALEHYTRSVLSLSQSLSWVSLKILHCFQPASQSGCGLVQPFKDMGQVQSAAKKEAFTRSCFSVSFPICIVFCFNKLWSAREIPKCLMSVGIKPTLKKVKLSKLGHCSLGLVGILDMILRALVDNLTDKYWRGSNVISTSQHRFLEKSIPAKPDLVLRWDHRMCCQR